MATGTGKKLTSSHWGVGLVTTRNGQVASITPHASDPDPSALNHNMTGSLNGSARVLNPAVRKGWLDGTDTSRGQDSFVEVSWEDVLDLIANELKRVKTEHGNQAIYAGSYGWASAGRFHHAQSQLKRFLNSIGGFTRSEGNYSYNAALVMMPHIVGGAYRQHIVEATRWSVVADHTELLVLFGGMPLRNTQICDGGNSKHRMSGNLATCAANGVECINISPLKSDVEEILKAEWLAPRPGSDTAIMLALAHTLLQENLHDQAFLDRYTTGFDQVAAYLMGDSDGQPKSVDWAAEISGIQADRLRALARQMASKRTMIGCAASLQRADWGEQPLWACVTLASMLGQIGLPGGGYTIGYGVNGHIGNVSRPFQWAAFPQGENSIANYIPVAMISEMLLNPGGTYQYEGQTRQFPDTQLVWWAGGNPFHHHQDLNQLRQAFQRPRTVIVNEINWTATARHADIVLPVAATTERTDFGAGRTDNFLVPMQKAVEPPGTARVEYEIYADLARRMGTAHAFTEGRTQDDWLRHMWAQTQQSAKEHGIDLPEWSAFITGDIIELRDPTPNQVFLADFRADPIAHKRATPSGLIELFSTTIARFCVPDCPGHAKWIPPRDQSQTTYPLALISGQPATRLHSQFDNGDVSKSDKIKGREPVLINPHDAANRGIADGDIVELFNDRGRCLAGARVTDDVMKGVVFLWTGAWYDPDFDAPDHRDRHGNPNVLTHDRRTSELSQSPAAHSAQIEIAKFRGVIPDVKAFQRPNMQRATDR
ncbi:MAG: molybdopterin-dependent oxidoreductase [Roseobacter sp.]